MSKTTTFIKSDQLDAEGKKVDDIFSIKEVETVEYEKNTSLSGTEVKEKLFSLEQYKSQAEKEVLRLTEEINFYKSLK